MAWITLPAERQVTQVRRVRQTGGEKHKWRQPDRETNTDGDRETGGQTDGDRWVDRDSWSLTETRTHGDRLT